MVAGSPLIQDGAHAASGTQTGVASLTTAELRLLAYLPSHLSFREIADQLFVSIDTVRSQAISIYSRLGVSSRGGAIEAAVAAGLLDASATRFPSAAPELDRPWWVPAPSGLTARRAGPPTRYRKRMTRRHPAA
ncbi:MAG: LuxR C-terminal-related transcriptional regulator [Candidatus Limnocylindrales bacterium]